LYEELITTGKAFGFLAVVTGPIAFVCWYFGVRGRPLIPPQRHRSVPWNGVQICLTAFSVLILAPVVGFAWISAFVSSPGGHGADSLLEVRRELWAQLVAFPLQIASIFLICLSLPGGRLYQFGLTSSDLARWFVLGWLAWICFTPLVLSLNGGVDWGYEALLDKGPERHRIEMMAELPLQPVDWFIIFLFAMVLAPFLEELLFRGVLQPWFAKKHWGGDVALAFSLFLALVLRATNLKAAWSTGEWAEVVPELTPLGFIVAIVPLYLFASRLSNWWSVPSPAMRAIFGTSMLFAMLHAQVWPTPVPLFFFALFLGYLAYRTQNIMPGIFVHSLFNGVATVQLLLAHLAQSK
jgi:membrane protease YdiL (CAAX protease family)